MTERQAGRAVLPELRPELQLLAGTSDARGQPNWLIHDPLSNRFIQIDAIAHETLRYWQAGDGVENLVKRVNHGGRVEVDADTIAQLMQFLALHQLTIASAPGAWRDFSRLKRAREHGVVASLIHNYLFFKIPLWRPQAFLERTLPLVEWLSSAWARRVLVAIGLAGLYLVSREWDVFVLTLQGYFTWEGAVASALALVIVKTAHELGHAYTAVAYGCRVHTMGLAFVVMAPMPYTDVTDAWRLTDRRQRLHIDSAGMLAEAAIAAVALFLWTFLPNGPLRSAAFLVSVVSIASSLAINLNPFMRFDGYYLLAEFLGVDNLQSRSFAVGRWKMRELLFGLGAPCPEELPAKRIRLLVLYAWATWLWRLALFIGIALLVYHYFFKLVGVILFAVEIIYFIARPVADEMKIWWTMRRQILATRRTFVSVCGATAMIVAAFVPWSGKVEIPAVIEAGELQTLFSVRSAQVVAVHVAHGGLVRAGEPIVTLASSEIDDEIARAAIALRIAMLQYGRRVSDALDREGSLVLESTISALKGKIAGLRKEHEELRITAPFDGRMVDFNAEVRPGRWVNTREPIGVLAKGERVVARGYAAEADVGRLMEGARGVFVPEHPMRHRWEVVVDRIAKGGSSQIEIAELASINTGRIAVVMDERRRLVPDSAQYLVSMSANGVATPSDLALRGVALVNGRPESLAARVWRRALGILVRESGA